MNLENLTPVEIDTIYVERLRALEAASRQAEIAADRVVAESGTFVVGRSGRKTVEFHVRKGCGLSYGRCYPIADILPHVLSLQTCLSEGLASAGAVEAHEAAQEALSEAREAVAEIDALYQASPWSRFWLVTSSDGHIHRSCYCHTCNKGHRATGFALVPSLSGRETADAVVDLGPALCTACFPEAPVESREQVSIPSRLALTLWENGLEAFKTARQKAAEDSQKRAAERCPGSGWQGNGAGYGRVKCTACGWSCRSTTGLVRPHKKRVS
jgi:hypothetical protein